MATVLNVKQLSYRHDDAPAPIFDQLDLRVEAGEFVAIVGQSGVGKSTMLRCVADLVPPAAGHISMQTTGDPTSRQYGFVFQDSRLLPWRRIRHNVAYGLKGLPLSKAEKRARVDEALALTLIDNLAERWPHKLSGGQQQRAGLARALAVHPEILLMDEPFSAVDALTRQRLQDELLRVWEKTRAAILFVTHDIEEAVYLADRVIVLAGSPAHVRLDQSIALPRPRERRSDELKKLAAAIKRRL